MNFMKEMGWRYNCVEYFRLVHVDTHTSGKTSMIRNLTFSPVAVRWSKAPPKQVSLASSQSTKGSWSFGGATNG